MTNLAAPQRDPQPVTPAVTAETGVRASDLPGHHVCCGILPPYLLRTLAKNEDDPAVARAAEATLKQEGALRGRRERRSDIHAEGHREGTPAPGTPGQGIIPDALRQRAGRVTAAGVERPTAESRRGVTGGATEGAEASPRRSIHDAEHGSALPGVLRRGEGDGPHEDESVNEAYDGLGATWALFEEVYERNSLDDEGLPLVATVHFDRDYDNAFWDGEQMVFGDGDGVIFRSFTDCLDVIGHELAHGFTQYTTGFVYVAQSGALNEHISDVFGVLTIQYKEKQTADEADWLIGKGLFTESVNGVALRSMKAPGTAYDDPRLGKDPQPATMDDYVKLPHDDRNDNGGVHINSGIPNHAFYLAATQLGGYAWERAGQVWFDVMTTADLPRDCQFAPFAKATIRVAATRYGNDSPEAAAVRAAWVGVKVLTESVAAATKPRRKRSTPKPD